MAKPSGPGSGVPSRSESSFTMKTLTEPKKRLTTSN